MPLLRLSIRWKYFLTLLALCLFPLVMVTLASHFGITTIEDTLAEDTQRAFSELSENALLQTAQTQSLLFQRTMQAVDFALRDLAKEVKLEQERAGSVSPGLVPPIQSVLDAFPNMATRVLFVSEAGQTYYFPQGKREPARPDEDVRRWYTHALNTTQETETAHWHGGGISAPGDPSLYAIYTIFGEGQGNRSLVAMEFSVLAKLNQGVTSAPWKARTHSFLVQTVVEDAGATGLEILAERMPGMEDWMVPIQGDRLSSPNAPGFNSVLDSIDREGAGTKVLPYEGEPCLWAWAPSGRGSCFITLVPTSVIGEKAKQVASTLSDYTRSTMVQSGLAALVTLLLITLAAFVGARRFSRPLIHVIRGVSRVSRGDFTVRLNMETGDEWDRLILGFNEMVPMLEETVAWRKRLELAREVQQSLMPESPPNVKGLDIAGRSLPAQSVGGDYYDYLKATQEQRLTVAVGDITGHGVGAALLMATARALVRRRSRRAGNLARIMIDINKQLAPDVADSGKFMTLFLAEVDVHRMVVRWANAGHDPALIYDPVNNHFESLEGGGLILGPFEDSVYEQYKRSISPGEIIILGTDGIWETQDLEGQYFGKGNLKQLVAEHAHLPSRAIIEKVFDALDKFRGSKHQEDDVTLVVIKVKEHGQEYKQLRLPDFQ